MEWEQMLKLMDENLNENYNVNVKEEIVFNNDEIENLRIAERKKITKHSFNDFMEFNFGNSNDFYFDEKNNNKMILKKYK